MRVLVLESERHAADAAITQLEGAGHQVLRCHEPAWQAFPCVGLTGECPVDSGIDAAVVVRNRGFGLPSPFEDGARCAARHGVPIVVVGDTATNPFERWTTAHAHGDDLVATVVEAAGAPLPHLTAAATKALNDYLGTTGAEAGSAEVRRGAGGLVVELVLPADTDAHVAEHAAVRVLSAVRKIDHVSPRVDVSVNR